MNYAIQMLLCLDAYWKSEGTSFAVFFPPTFNWGTTGECKLVIASRYTGTVRVDAASISLNQTYAVTALQRLEISLLTNTRPSGAGYSNDAVFVTSDVDITVVAYNFVPSTGTSGGQRSGHLLFPVTSGDNYIVHTHYDSHSSTAPHAYFTVAAFEDNTEVSVYQPLTSGGYYYDYSFTLNRGLSFANTSSQAEDFSGVKLVSTKRISVLAGHGNLKLTQETAWRTQAVGSSIFPERALTSDYVIPVIDGGDNLDVIIRVVALLPGTTVVSHNEDAGVNVKEGNVAEFYSPKKSPSTISCSQICSVAVYTYQDNGGSQLTGSVQIPVVPLTAYTRLAYTLIFHMYSHSSHISSYFTLVSLFITYVPVSQTRILMTSIL